VSAFLTLVEREIVRFYRQPSRVIGALLTPILFWVFIGAGVGNSIQVGAGDVGYLRWFYPGVLVLIVFFTAIFSTISVIEDRREGFLQSVLVAPVPRITVAGAKIAGGSLLALGQAALFLLLAPLGHLPISPLSALLTLAALALVAAGLTGLGFVMAWSMESTQGFHAVMNVVLLPMWILSGAAFPLEGAHGWLRFLMRLNPMTYGVALVRAVVDPAARGGLPIQLSLGITVAFALSMIAAASLITRRRDRVVAA
jgi:ABC-2 type transport system permease protein